MQVPTMPVGAARPLSAQSMATCGEGVCAVPTVRSRSLCSTGIQKLEWKGRSFVSAMEEGRSPKAPTSIREDGSILEGTLERSENFQI